MSRDDLFNAMKYGSDREYTTLDLGRFGLGLKNVYPIERIEFIKTLGDGVFSILKAIFSPLNTLSATYLSNIFIRQLAMLKSNEINGIPTSVFVVIELAEKAKSLTVYKLIKRITTYAGNYN